MKTPLASWKTSDDGYNLVTAVGARLGFIYREEKRWAWVVYGPSRPGVSTGYGSEDTKRDAMIAVAARLDSEYARVSEA